MSRFREVFGEGKIVIGMIHLPPLPGYPESAGIKHVIRHAVADLGGLEDCNVRGVLVENEYDRPHRVKSAPETTAAMTRVTRAVVQESETVIVGCEILLNDPFASLAVAAMTGARFIRTDYFVDRMSRPEYGEFDIDPDGLMRFRDSLDAGQILVLADVQVKYATMLEPRPIHESARLAVEKGADAIVVTGSASGMPPTVAELRDAAQGRPVLVGSGLTPNNAAELLAACDGAIVGTSIMKGGSVDIDALEFLMSQLPSA